MIEFDNVKIFTDNIEAGAVAQIKQLVAAGLFDGVPVRIMPDAHSGAGCVIGFTAPLTDKLTPNLIGVDIGCGILTVDLHTDKVSFDKLDRLIRKNIPFGREVGEISSEGADIVNELYCRSKLKQRERLYRAVGSLGGGNHFIEIDEDDKRNKYLTVHTGSRNLGKQVAEYYQEKAIKSVNGFDPTELIERLKSEGREKDIQAELENAKRAAPKLDNALCYLQGEDLEAYMHDMRLCMRFAEINRRTIAEKLCSGLKLDCSDGFTTRHNYIGEDNIIRKGAISAKEGERVLIPLNMRDGCIIGTGKGVADWNNSAPHGAGRRMSRGEAMKKLDLEKFKQCMKGIYSTTVGKDTLDEAPQAYKPAKEIISLVTQTVDIEKIIKPVYNFKAAE